MSVQDKLKGKTNCFNDAQRQELVRHLQHFKSAGTRPEREDYERVAGLIDGECKMVQAHRLQADSH